MAQTKPKIVNNSFTTKMCEIELFEFENPLGHIYCTISDYDRVIKTLNNLSRYYKFNHNGEIKYSIRG